VNRPTGRRLGIIVLAALLAAPAAPAHAQDANAPEPIRSQTDTEKRAIGYLLAHQADNGAWLQQVGPGVTALIARGFVQGGKSADDPIIKNAMNYIESTRQSDGGFYSQGQPTYHTAIVLSLLAKLPSSQYGEQIKKAQDFLKLVQSGSPQNSKDDQGKTIKKEHAWYGGWGYGGGEGRPDMSNSHFVIEALRDSGVPANDPAIQNALVFLSRMQSSEQNDLPWSKGRADGGFIYAMGWNAQHDFYGQSSVADHADRDGNMVLTTYGSMTYAGLKSLIYCDLKHDDPRVQSVLKWVGNNWTLETNPGTGNASGLFYYYLTFASGLSAYGEDGIVDAKGVRHDWRKEYEEHLKSIQHPDGSFANSTADRWMEQVPELATAYVVLGLQAARQKSAPPPATPPANGEHHEP
jgi:squalene-hopene/tetraprenyl-beta-curcumene cyclase